MAKYNLQIREEELKNKVAADFFPQFDTTQIVGNIDFSVALPMGTHSSPSAANLGTQRRERSAVANNVALGTSAYPMLDLFDADFFLWGEAKKGDKQDIDDSLVQLLVTIIKAKTYNSFLPPLYLAAFDAEKIAFLPYDTDLQKQVLFDEHLENTVDWKSVTPSDHHATVFLKIKQHAAPLLEKKILFDYEKDEKDLRRFIRDNFKAQKEGTNKINITLNRMTAVFNRWLEIVKPTIKIDWANLAKENIVPADFFLADALSKNNWSLGETLKVLLRTDFYMMNLKVKVGDALMDTFTNVQFTDKQKAHQAFWNRYNRPPSKREREKMQERRDLLIEPDRRERKGAFFTPHRWVELSQEYLAQTLGENWQEEYYVWDCCAGTGNLLYGLTEKERIFASTLDDADVRFMQQQDFLLPKHVFQFDFLNDDLQDADKVPADLRRILADEQLRKKLVIYINPPYAEAGNKKQVTDTGENKTGVAVNMKTYTQYLPEIGIAGREVFAQFFIRIYHEIHGAVLAEFSKLKILQAPNFRDFRSIFQAKLENALLVPADTFDNVKGKFPIGFFIWDTATNEIFNGFNANVYDSKGLQIGKKEIICYDKYKNISDWIIETRKRKSTKTIAFMSSRSDVQNINLNFIINSRTQLPHPRGTDVTDANLIEIAVFYSVNHTIEATWLNDRDQFLYPNEGWKSDYEFQADCLVYTLFHGQNRISVVDAGGDVRVPKANHWIPFTEKEVGAQSLFTSHFMSDYLAGKITGTHSCSSAAETDLFSALEQGTYPSSVVNNAALETSAYPSSVADNTALETSAYPSSVVNNTALGTSAYPSSVANNTALGTSAYPIHDHCRKYLPHIENKRLQFITFRLYDSLPKEVIDTWKEQLDYENINIDENMDDKTRQMLVLIDKFEDSGYGQCFFNDERVRKIMSSSLHYNDGKKYNLLSYCIMPNHVHVLVEMYDGYGLSEIVSNWRSYTAHEANKILGRKGDFWMHEYFDRYIRDDKHLSKTLNYIANNPIKANLTDSIDKWAGYYLVGTQQRERSSVAINAALETSAYPATPLDAMSEQARAVMDAGRELWRYYHSQPDANADASYYDIRRYFQGTDEKGRMNPDSEDKEYMRLWDNLKAALKLLAAHIEPKVYKYGFLLGSNLQTEAEQSLFE